MIVNLTNISLTNISLAKVSLPNMVSLAKFNLNL